ncbi:hypothetical protein ABPG72_010961 [Tetrahymena utriculariae]
MNKNTLQFVNKSLEKQYFDKVSFPFYSTIFSVWCKVLIMISIPCSLFTYFTGNLQYLEFLWCIVTSASCLLIIKYYKSSFNIVTAIYNVGFVVLNIGFILITNKNIGAQGQQNNMMFIFAGSQYMFHFILSIGSNFLLNSAVIFIQNFSYSAVFFPGVSILKNSILVKNNRNSTQNGFSDTLERFIYYGFKTMIQKSTILKSNNKPQTPTKKLFNISKENSQQIDQSNTLQLNDPKQVKDSFNLTAANFTCSRQKGFPSSQVNTKEKKKINQKQQNQLEGQQKKEKYNVEEFKAFIMKNNVKQEVLVKIVFYYTSQPVCSISIDEGLKQKVVNISRQSKQKESLYFQHFLRIAQKFQTVISCKDPQLFQTSSLLHLNHLRNLQDLISLIRDVKLKAKYTPFQFNNLLKYISSIFSLFLILKVFNFPQQLASKSTSRLNMFSFTNETQNQSELPKKSLILQENQQNPAITNNGYYNFEGFKTLRETYNDQQRINQVIINLLENALEFKKKQKTTNKYVQLKIDLIQGKDEQSNLIQIKVINNMELNYSKQEIYLIKDSLRIERDLSNPNYLWQSQSSLKPTYLGLKQNQKILDRTSPYNYMEINCLGDEVEFSFFIYQNCSILLQNTQLNFTNKTFDQIRVNQIEQSYMPSTHNINKSPQQQQYQDGDQSSAAYIIEQKIQQQITSEVQILQQSQRQELSLKNNQNDESSKYNIQKFFYEIDYQEEHNEQINNIVLKFDSKHMSDINKKCQNKQMILNQ